MDREYLNDSAFLKDLDNYRNKFYLVKIIVLDMQEKPISEIHGRIQDGSTINIDGNSAIRRTCNLTFIALEKENDLTDVENLLSINKKIKIEVGIVNNFHNNYKDVDVFWFPQGIFVIEDPSISNGADGCTISLSCKDKMALLNGECGGNLPASVTFHEYDQIIGTMSVTDWPSLEKGDLNNYTIYDFGREINGSRYWRWNRTDGFYACSEPEEGKVEIEHMPNLIYDIIQTLVCNYGGESLDKIIINDVPLQIKQIVMNSSGSSLYYNPKNKVYSLNQNYSADSSGDWLEFETGAECGYVYSDFIFPGKELVSGVNDNVCSVLNKIKNVLGNFEFFYDIDGNFVFQEKKNYLNVSYLPVSNAKMLTPLDYTASIFKHYLDAIDTLPTDEGRENLIIETLNNYNLLSNETYQKVNYSVTYPSVEHITKKILISYMYETHRWEIINNLYLIDQNNYLVDYNSNKKSIYDFDADSGIIINFSNSPSYTNIKNDFHIWGKQKDNATATHYHLAIKSKPTTMTPRKVVLTSEGQLNVVGEKDEGQYYTPDDWRVEIYLRGKEKIYLHERPDIYEQEILDMLPTIYTFEKQDGKIIGRYKEDITKSNSLTYFVDYLEPVDDFYDISVDLIGPRIYSFQQDNVTKLFDNDIPNVIIINTSGDRIYNQQIIEKCRKEGQPYVNVDSVVYSNLIEGASGYSAQEVARDLLYQYTDYNSAITFSCMPIFYLEPNTRITVRDKKSGIYGDYIINRITRPLGAKGTMNITATKALERI